jgi:hypothetical protein
MAGLPPLQPRALPGQLCWGGPSSACPWEWPWLPPMLPSSTPHYSSWPSVTDTAAPLAGPPAPTIAAAAAAAGGGLQTVPPPAPPRLLRSRLLLLRRLAQAVPPQMGPCVCCLQQLQLRLAGWLAWAAGAGHRGLELPPPGHPAGRAPHPRPQQQLLPHRSSVAGLHMGGMNAKLVKPLVLSPLGDHLAPQRR